MQAHMLLPMLLPGIVFCCMMALDQYMRGFKPEITIYHCRVPVWFCYLCVLLTGPLLLILMLVNGVKGNARR